jgi:xanthine/uracil permease
MGGFTGDSNRASLEGRFTPVLMSLLMLVIGVSLANIGWWFGRRDVECISRRVREALISGGG